MKAQISKIRAWWGGLSENNQWAYGMTAYVLYFTALALALKLIHGTPEVEITVFGIFGLGPAGAILLRIAWKRGGIAPPHDPKGQSLVEYLVILVLVVVVTLVILILLGPAIDKIFSNVTGAI